MSGCGHEHSATKPRRELRRLPREISPGVWWVGGCLKSGAFEEPVHFHTSAHLVIGTDKTLLYDTAPPSMWDDMDRDLDRPLGGRPLAEGETPDPTYDLPMFIMSDPPKHDLQRGVCIEQIGMGLDARGEASCEEGAGAIDEGGLVIGGRREREHAGVHGAIRVGGIAAIGRVTDGRARGRG